MVPALAVTTAGALLFGLRESWTQGYLRLGWGRLIALSLSTAMEDALLIGGAAALMMGAAAALTALAFRRPLAAWVAAWAAPAAVLAGVFVLRAGLAARFSSLFPAEYGGEQAIRPDTVFWVFLPPLLRGILLNDPVAHWRDLTAATGLTISGAFLAGALTALFLRAIKRPVDAPPRFSGKAWIVAGAFSLGVAAATLNLPAFAARDASHPDVVLVSIDTLRPDALGCYGFSPSPSANIDAFAAQATRFTRGCAPSPWTIPSHVGLLTSLSNEHHGANDMDSRASDGIVTLAERFAEAGYDTAAFVNTFLLSPRYGFGQGFRRYEMIALPPAGEVARRAGLWLRGGRRAPFFLFVHLFDPHWPYGIPDDSLPGARAASFHEFVRLFLTADETQRESWRRRYREDVARADRAFGALIDSLRAVGRFDDAWVILVSDHGEEFWEHGFIGHAVTLYDEVLHVPLLVKRPGQRAGDVVDRPVSLLDVPATLNAALRLPGPAKLDGRPLFGENDAERALTASTMIWGEPRFALRRGCRKAITPCAWHFGDFRGARQAEAFDLCADAGESVNLAASPEAQAMLAELQTLAAQYEGASRSAAGRATAAERTRLKELGYLP
jgi:arylsulfatase A-like enzyme